MRELVGCSFWKKPRQTVAVASALREGLMSSFAVWRRASAPFALLALAFGLHARAATGSDALPVTVVLDYDHSQSGTSFLAMQSKLDATMHSAGIQLALRKKNTLTKTSEFESLLVFKMKGTCSMSAQNHEAPSRVGQALAMAFTTGNEVLPFGEVECDRVRQSLQRVLGMGAHSEEDERLYGSALAVVMAHEIYHMLTNVKHHTREGVTKERLSARDLLDGKLPLSNAARSALEQRVNKIKEPVPLDTKAAS